VTVEPFDVLVFAGINAVVFFNGYVLGHRSASRVVVAQRRLMEAALTALVRVTRGTSVHGWGVWHAEDEEWIGFGASSGLAAEMVPEGYDHLALRPVLARIEVAADGEHHLQVGDRVVVDFTDAMYDGREGAITAIHPDSPAAQVEGCPILDVILDGEESIIIPAKAVRHLRPPTCPACFGKGRVDIICELCGGSGSYELTPEDDHGLRRDAEPAGD
jgi:hypothetical protein